MTGITGSEFGMSAASALFPLSPARGRGRVRGLRTSIPPHLASPPSGGEEFEGKLVPQSCHGWMPYSLSVAAGDVMAGQTATTAGPGRGRFFVGHAPT